MNAEQDVIDAIDALVDETMAAGLDSRGHPRDDYNADRYPACPQCGHQWHGIKCLACKCPRSEGEVGVPMSAANRGIIYTDQISSVRRSHDVSGITGDRVTVRRDYDQRAAVRRGIDPEAPWLPLDHYDSDQRGSAAQIIQDCRFDRNGRCVYNHVHTRPRSAWPRLEMQSAHIRLWADTGSRGPQYLAGLIGYYQAHEHSDGDVDVVLGIEEAGNSQTIVENQSPADELPPGQAALELYQWRTDEFRTIGYVPEDNVTIDHRIDFGETSRGRPIAMRESYEIRLRLERHTDRMNSILERLLGLGQ